jgi:hypothetical protein
MGFAIKPFFVMTFAFVELYCMYHKRNFFAWVRLESLIIIGFLWFYTLLICVFYSNYFYMLQLALDLYYQGMGYPWKEMVFVPTAFFCYLALMLYLIQYKSSHYKILGSIFAIATVTLLISHFLQHTNWYYHILPAYSFALILIVLLMTELLGQKDLPARNYIQLSALSLMIAGYLYFKYQVISTSLVIFPTYFYIFFSILFIFAFCIQGRKNSYKALLYTLLIMAISFWVTFVLKNITYNPHRFTFTILLLLLVYGFFVRGEKRFHVIFATTVTMLILAFPYYNCIFRNWMSSNYIAEVSNLSRFINKYAQHQSVQFFSTTMCFEFPAIDYAEALPASRYAFFVWMPGLLKLGLLSGDDNLNKRLVDDRNYLFNSVAEDLDLRKPALVFVDVAVDKIHMRGVKFEYLDKFLLNKHFQQSWKSYHYFTTLEKVPFYKYEVYRRRVT